LLVKKQAIIVIVSGYLDQNSTQHSGAFHMPLSTLISSIEAAELKSCTRQAIVDAITRGDLDGQLVGHSYNVRRNKKFEQWMANPRRQKAGREGHKSGWRKG
jgi:hypothetical protein